MKKFKLFKYFQDNLLIFIILVLTLISRLLYLSPYLEDWDSVQFALAMQHFSIVKDLPHAPGYPLYIILGHVMKSIFQTDLLSLELLSAILGTASVFITYLIATKMFNKLVGLAAAVILASLPVHWSLSEVALTNIPGLFFLTLLVYLLYKYRDSHKALILTSLGFGLMLGVRFTEFPIIVSLIFLATVRQKKLRLIVYSFIAFLIGILLWLAPLIYFTGFNDFIKAYSTIASYIVTHDSLMGSSTPGFSTIKIRVDNLLYLLKIAYTPTFILISGLTIIFLILKRNLLREFRYQLLIIWFFSYFIPLVFFFNLEVTRYTLPLTVPISILVAGILRLVIKNKTIYIGFITIISVTLLLSSFDQVNKFKNSTPPIVDPILLTKAEFKPAETTVIPTLLKRHFQYYAPEFLLVDTNETNISIINSIQSFSLSKFVIIDHLSTIDEIKDLKNYNIKDKKQFYGDREIYNRVPSTTIYILERY